MLKKILPPSNGSELQFGRKQELNELMAEKVDKKDKHIQKILAHSHVSTTMIYTHVLNPGAGGVISPLDKM